MKTAEKLLVELFRRVKLDYSLEQIYVYCEQDEWFYFKSWTKEEEQDFIKWAFKVVKKNEGWATPIIEKSINFFVMNYGWKIEEK